jgi:hypothetical protein
MAWWYRPGSFGCSSKAPYPSPVDKATSDETVFKTVTIGAFGIPNVIRYDATFTVPVSVNEIHFEVATGYMPDTFNNFYTYDTQSKALSAFARPVGNPTTSNDPIIISTANKKYAMAEVQLALPQYLRDGANRAFYFPANTSKWGCNASEGPSGPKNYSYSCFIVVGTLAQVTAGIDQLTQAFQVSGVVDGISPNGDGTYNVSGWACQLANPNSIPVDLYVGGPVGTGTEIGRFEASLPSGPDVAAACQSWGNNYRYSINLTAEQLSVFAGKTPYLYGISPTGLSNNLLLSSGTFPLPPFAGLPVSSSITPKTPNNDGAAVAWGPNRDDVFYQAPNNVLGHQWWDGSVYRMETLPASGGVNSAVSAVSWGPNLLDVFYQTTSGFLGHSYWRGNGWQTELLFGGVASTPSAVAWGPNRFDLFYKTKNGLLGHQWWNGAPGQWWQTETLGGALASDPIATSWGPNRLDVFYQGSGLNLEHQYWDGIGAGWHLESLATGVASIPSAVSWAPNRFDVFYRNTTNGLGHQWFDGTHWQVEAIGGATLASAPSAVSIGPNRLDVFYQAASPSGNPLGHYSWNNGWTSQLLPGAISGAPVAIANGQNLLDIYYQVPNGVLGHQFEAGANWGIESLSTFVTQLSTVKLP